MTIREVSVEYSRTVNLGDYQSERIQVGLVESVGPQDDASVLRHALFCTARDAVEAEAAELKRRREEADEAERRRWQAEADRYRTKPQVDEEDHPDTGGL